MASTRILRRRIKSVKNTAQITKAMQMVAATKMRRAQNQAINGRPYSGNLSFSLAKVLPAIDADAHPLMAPNGSQVQGVVLLSTDKGLVGALNTNILRAVIASNFPKETQFFTIGRKGRQFVVKLGKDLKADFENPSAVAFRQAKQLTKLLIDAYLAGEIGEIYLIYPQFVSTLRQEADKVKLLPIEAAELINMEDQGNKGNLGEENQEFIIEPNARELLGELLTHHIETKIYQALLETKASEHSAQMVAMKNATDNALELVEDLKLTYNQTRQGNITAELLEITSAQAAME